MPLRLADIVARLGGEVAGDNEVLIAGVGTLTSAQPNQAAFLAHGKYRHQLQDTRAGVVVLSPADAEFTTRNRIVCSNPYVYFARLSSLLNPPAQHAPGIHPSAVIDADAKIDPSACIMAFVRIGSGARIGAGVVIEPGAVIGDSVLMGSQCVIHANVVLYPGCQLGERVILHSGVIVGADGFGYAPSQGKWEKIPQIGRVLIGDDVEIGANTTIDRGALDDTVIEEGVKLDNQIQVGHNVRIGAHTVIAGCTCIAGSTRIGKHCRIGGGAMITGHIEIGDRVDIGGGTGVTKSIAKPGTYTGVMPFTSHDRWLRNAVHARNLDAMVERIKGLEQRLKILEGE